MEVANEKTFRRACGGVGVDEPIEDAGSQVEDLAPL